MRLPPRSFPLVLSALLPACFVDMPEVEPTDSGDSSSASSTGELPDDSATSTTGVDDSTGADPSTGSSSATATDESSTGAQDSSTTDAPAGPRLVFITEGEFFAG